MLPALFTTVVALGLLFPSSLSTATPLKERSISKRSWWISGIINVAEESCTSLQNHQLDTLSPAIDWWIELGSNLTATDLRRGGDSGPTQIDGIHPLHLLLFLNQANLEFAEAFGGGLQLSSGAIRHIIGSHFDAAILHAPIQVDCEHGATLRPRCLPGKLTRVTHSKITLCPPFFDTNTIPRLPRPSAPRIRCQLGILLYSILRSSAGGPLGPLGSDDRVRLPTWQWLSAESSNSRMPLPAAAEDILRSANPRLWNASRYREWMQRVWLVWNWMRDRQLTTTLGFPTDRFVRVMWPE